METIEKSLEELMNEAYNLALKLAFSSITETGHYFDVREGFPLGGDSDRIFSWVDGLEHKFYHNKMSGRCSLQSTIDFDIESYEKSVIADIEEFSRLIKIYGEPRVLSKENLRARGYRGEWAGYTKKEDHEFSIQQAKECLDGARKELNAAKGYDQNYFAQQNVDYCQKRLEEISNKTP
jgi:hypothetical protein